MDVKYINPFVIAAQTVFKTMLSIELSLGKPSLKEAKTTSGDVTGIMSMVGDRKGTIAISFREKGALFVFNSLMGDEAAAMSPEVVDAIGELTNIISGQARKEFENSGINLKASIPMVVVGHGVETNFITKLPIISLPFNFSVNNGIGEVMFLDFSFE
ncbi:MAG: CheY-P phosphatase CheX [Syntrophorhabdaceae bacterium PtaU1.Bin034]|jgi:chemotaxis protein CheX|nr:MAG: CheY-P phosphatase CheX [Syntrophorhabdaceae bacterium PtaU1.Bin034]